MKAQGGGDQVDERRDGLEFDSGEIAIAGEVALRLMPADAGPAAVFADFNRSRDEMSTRRLAGRSSAKFRATV
jgi:hypothetical protein